jgi:hypothetical protein
VLVVDAVVVVVVGPHRLLLLPLVVVVVRERVAGCGCGGCFPWVSHGAMYSILCTEIMWPVGILGKRLVRFGSRKSRVRLSL